MLEKGRPRGLFLSDRVLRPTAYVITEDAAFGFIEPLSSPATGAARQARKLGSVSSIRHDNMKMPRRGGG